MNGSIVVDTNAVIAYREGLAAVCTSIEEADIIFLPAVVLGELLFGAANSGRPESNQQAVHKFQDECAVVPIDESIATRYSQVRLDLKRKGRPIPENDIWIAAVCLELDSPLLTRDRHFEHVSDLQVNHWETTQRI